ncbi:MAG: hypothetical protein IPJ60_19405 [Sphingobacteriaceae bacterium]|nr:hypothetical protein [Sphingobacteriaceae bacterium]
MSTRYYIYLHVRLTDGQPFYIGKGSGKRAFVKRNRSIHWKNIVNKYGYDILLLEETLGEKEAHTLEKYWINRIGRLDLKLGTLVNFT